MGKIIIGLVGPIAAGKSTIVEYLKSKGYSSYSLSDRIRDEIKNKGLEITRETLNITSNEMRQNIGPDVFAKKTVEMVEKDSNEHIVIDSIRNPKEIECLKTNLPIKIIGLIAPQEKRFDFFSHRTTNVAGITTWEQFKELDDMELAQSGDYKQQVQACLDMADIKIENSGTIEDLQKKVDEFIKS